MKIMVVSKTIGIWLLFSLLQGTVLAGEAVVPGPGFEQVISLREVSDPVVSPDGRSVAFVTQSADWQDNRFRREIWLVRAGEEPFPLTRSMKGASDSPRWSPDGRWLAFLSDRDGSKQLYAIRVAGGEARKLSSHATDIDDFRWAPDGRTLAFLARADTEAADTARSKRYGDFAVEDTDYKNTRLWQLPFEPDPNPAPEERPCLSNSADDEADAEAGVSKSSACPDQPRAREILGSDGFSVNSFEWSPDGSRVVYGYTASPSRDDYATADIAVLTLDGGATRVLVDKPGFDTSPQWSPDGKWILYISAAGNTTSDYYKNGQLLKIPVAGGEPVRLGAAVDEELDNVRWTPGGIYALVLEKTARRIYRIDPDTGKARVFGADPADIWSLSFSADGKTLAFSGQNGDSLVELYSSKASRFAPRKLTDLTAQIKGWDIGSNEVISWSSRDGTPIEGVLYKPTDYDPARKYPLLVVIHGGPSWLDYPVPLDGYVYPTAQWLAKGALVLSPNYRGSAGYGEAFRSLNVRNLGVGDAWDVMSGVDHLVKMGIVDETRMGAMGWSQGGYISAFLTTNTDRFAAISVGAGISDWMTYYVNTDIHPFTRQYLQDTPWNDPEIYAVTSPMTNITKARTPTLIQHGEFDKRVPIPNAYELYQGLNDVGVDARLVVYKGFGHGISKPRELLAANWHNYQWFAKYLWGEEVELPIEVTANK
jgi:dipeptidyl aminopeptidase/acylaminoacyl peptidase